MKINIISKTKLPFLKKKIDVPEQLFVKCNECGKMMENSKVIANFSICPECGAYFTLTAQARVEMITDNESFQKLNIKLRNTNPLKIDEYDKRRKALKKETGLDEAVLVGTCKIAGQDAIIGVMDSRFLLGSLSSQVGKLLVESFDYATEHKLPFILYTVSGGARMQEGIVSLMQMATVSAAVKRHSNAGLFYMPILTNPTTGGVTASFAMLGDIIAAEPKALICFAGPRVIKDTIKQELPEGFQKSEFLLEKGFLDLIIPRENQSAYIANFIRVHKGVK